MRKLLLSTIAILCVAMMTSCSTSGDVKDNRITVFYKVRLLTNNVSMVVTSSEHTQMEGFQNTPGDTVLINLKLKRLMSENGTKAVIVEYKGLRVN